MPVADIGDAYLENRETRGSYKLYKALPLEARQTCPVCA